MTKIEKSVREVSDLRDFYEKISKMRIERLPENSKHNKQDALNGSASPRRK